MMKGQWCPYRQYLLCQEEKECLNCNIYYETMPVPYGVREESSQEGGVMK